MSVYVDDMEAPFGRMVMCHMFADTCPELIAMADKIGVQRKWLQDTTNTSWVHFDIALSKRKLAVKYGAIEVAWRDIPAYAFMQQFEPSYSLWY